MSIRICVQLPLASLGLAVLQGAGAPFENLGFEAARTNAVTPAEIPGFPRQGTGPVSDLLPGWQLLQNGTPVTVMDYNNTGTFEQRDYLSLINPFPPSNRLGPPPATEGQYYVHFRLLTSDQYSLTQRGEIPTDAQLLFFEYRLGPWIASINGEDISPLQLPSGGGIAGTTVFADVSQFAGQEVELSFRPLLDQFGVSAEPHQLDNIGFVIPEPSTYALLALGLGVWGGRCLWRRRGEVSEGGG